MLCPGWHFYPRPPGGGRLKHTVPENIGYGISIHALRVEGDRRLRQTCPQCQDFYPRPPGGGRLTPYTSWTSCVMNFYPRPPDGGRHSIHFAKFKTKTFLSTPSGWRATLNAGMGCAPVAVFLSTPSGWRATRSILSGSKVKVFLSTPSGWRATSSGFYYLI